MLYQINVASQHYVFEDLKTLLAKATPDVLVISWQGLRPWMQPSVSLHKCVWQKYRYSSFCMKR